MMIETDMGFISEREMDRVVAILKGEGWMEAEGHRMSFEIAPGLMGYYTKMTREV